MIYKDFTFTLSEYNTTVELTGVNAIMNAIKSLILGRNGNFPLTPSACINIQKYQFEILDDVLLRQIKSELSQQISRFVPTIDNISISVDKVEDTINGKPVTALGIKVSVIDGDNVADGYFLVTKDHEDINIYDEIHN